MKRLWTLVAIAIPVNACSAPAEPSASDAALREMIEARGLTGDPAAGRNLPSIGDPLATLGRKLFFSKTLSGDRDTACATCHHPVLGGGDDLPLSIGVGAAEPDLLGPGRTHPEGELTVPRNAPSTFNIGLFQKGLFWDSRIEELGDRGIRTPDSAFGAEDPAAGDSIIAAQARFPVTSAEEMRGFEFVQGGTNDELRSALERRLSEDRRWAPEFETVFGSPEITYARIAEAIGTYEASQVFTETSWRAYVEGDDEAIDDDAKRGALLFYRSTDEGGADCGSCHSGDFFTDESFWAICAPQIGRGKGDGPTETNDFGRARETGMLVDRYAFRTPSLLNVAVTGPFLHSGAYENLDDVIRHHFDPLAESAVYDPSSVPQAAMEGFEDNRLEILETLVESPRAIPYFDAPLTYSERDVADLVAFLETLTDPCVLDRTCLSPWIADPETDDVDGHLLVAVDENGRPL